MDKELIINSSPTEVEIAFLENGKLVEIHRQKTSVSFSVGDIFLGKIRKTMPSLNAAFLDIGHRKDAFLHYTDLGPQIKSVIKYTNEVRQKRYNSPTLENFEKMPDNPKDGKIGDVLPKDTEVLVQILKEPISTKGPRLSCELTIPGRYLVLSPFYDSISISKKIGSTEERKRLKVLIESIKPKNFGIIARTASEGKKVADLHSEVRELMNKWAEMRSELSKVKGPDKLLSEIDKATSILRDVLSGSFSKILCNDKEIVDSIKNYLKGIAPDQVKIVKHYKGQRSIFDANDVTRQIKASFGKTSTMSSGAYLVIEHTEAMHVIDVNSGPKMIRKAQEDASLAVNMEAAEEIARQLRLRDIGGLIIIDFIDMRSSENRSELLSAMRKFMSNDRAQHTILPLSKFGLMQITRQRVRPAVKIDTREVCSTCSGSGKSKASILVTDDIKRDLEFLLETRPDGKFTLKVHPFVKSYLTKGLKSIQVQWWLNYRKWIKLTTDNDYALFEYTFYDKNGDEIRLD